jgi:hypothetical protein
MRPLWQEKDVSGREAEKGTGKEREKLYGLNSRDISNFEDVLEVNVKENGR